MQRVAVTLDEHGRPDAGLAYYLLDRDDGTLRRIDANRFTVHLDDERPLRRLRLILGTPGFAEAHREAAAPAIARTALWPGYPNPFAAETTFRYQLAQPGPATLAIYNVLGQRVRTLTVALHEAGLHELRWDGRTDAGYPAAPGTYLARLQTDGFTATRTVLLHR